MKRKVIRGIHLSIPLREHKEKIKELKEQHEKELLKTLKDLDKLKVLLKEADRFEKENQKLKDELTDFKYKKLVEWLDEELKWKTKNYKQDIAIKLVNLEMENQKLKKELEDYKKEVIEIINKVKKNNSYVGSVIKFKGSKQPKIKDIVNGIFQQINQKLKEKRI